MKITLCGSTKFMDEFEKWNRDLTVAGHVVYTVMASVHGDYKPTEKEKEQLDLIHFAKIVHSDAIVVLNKDGYIGFSTRREIKWAKIMERIVLYIDPPDIHSGDATDLLE